MSSNLPSNRFRRYFQGNAFRIWVTLGVFLLGALPLTAQNRFDGVRAIIHRQIVDDSVPSISVAVAQHGKIVWEEGFGWANREKQIHATPNTMYSIASISKPMTATGLMTLVQAGKIDLNKPINDYLGNAKLKAWVGNANDATVRCMADHTSGIPAHVQFFFSNQPYVRPPFPVTILRYGQLFTIPCEHFQYANLGYGIIDYVLSRVSGESYPAFMRQNVFIPLGMTHTSVDIGPGLAEYEAIRYDDTGAPIPFYVTDHPGASEIYSSAHDMIRFAMFQLKDHLPNQKQILTDASIDEMQRPEAKVPDNPNGNGYGFGWFTTDNRPDGYRLVSHTGGMPGVAAMLMLVPSEDTALVVLTNNSGTFKSIMQIVNAIAKVVLPKWQDVPLKPQAPIPPFKPTAELLGTWKGTLRTYQKDLPVTITFLPSGGVHFKIAKEPISLLDDAQFKDGWLTGGGWGSIQTSDAKRHHVDKVMFQLKLRGKHLSGAVIAGKFDAVELSEWLDVVKQP